MNKQKLLYLISKGESTKIDFKLKLSLDTESTRKEFSKDISAIANTRSGRGYLIFGVEDKTKKIVGIDPLDFLEEQLQQIIASRVDPPIPINVDIINLENKDLAIVTIFNSNQRPHQMWENGAFYIRRGTTTDIMRKDEIASMIHEYGLLPYETIPISTSSISDLDINLLNEYLKKLNITGDLDYNILEGLGILSKGSDSPYYVPTYGGILLFCKHPQIYLPHSIIKIHNKNNKTVNRTIICSGNILDMLKSACDLINKCKHSNIPIEMIEDLLGNSVVHRDYFSINTFIEVYVKENSVEIINPGFKKDYNDSASYSKRNMWLYLKLLSIDNNNRFFNKDVRAKDLTHKKLKIRHYNIESKNIFKVVIKCY